MQPLNYYAIPGLVTFIPKTHKQVTDISVDKIITAVCSYFSIDIGVLKNKSKNSALVTPRHIAMYLIKTQTSEKLSEIGKRFNRDHTTVLHAMNKVNGFLDIKDETTIKAIQEINNNIRLVTNE